jgi:hypothetical protein
MLKPHDSFRVGWQFRLLYRYIREGTIGWAMSRTLAYIESRVYHLIVGHHRRIDEDWDVLIICDALRADAVDALELHDADEQRVKTAGLWSLPWLKQCIEGLDRTDTVYVGANAYIEYIDTNGLFARYITFTPETDEVDRVHPAAVCQLAQEAAEAHPDKRLIVHFMQPHVPFFIDGEPIHDVWERVKSGELDDATLRERYHENVAFVRPYVNELIETLPGKVVLTADHGENLGERRLGVKRYGHSHWTPECVWVPWVTLPHGERTDVRRSEPIDQERGDSPVEEQLALLGYR